MKRNKKYLLISGLILILIVLIICILAYLNNTKNGYTFSEKSFINSNINNVIDVGVELFLYLVIMVKGCFMTS